MRGIGEEFLTDDDLCNREQEFPERMRVRAKLYVQVSEEKWRLAHHITGMVTGGSNERAVQIMPDDPQPFGHDYASEYPLMFPRKPYPLEAATPPVMGCWIIDPLITPSPSPEV